MASAAEHYVHAEKLLAEARAIPDGYDNTNPAAALLYAEATVYAALSRVAVLASSMARSGELSDAEVAAWSAAFGAPIERRTTPCEVCEGGGIIPGDRGEGRRNEKCWNCGGDGRVPARCRSWRSDPIQHRGEA